jgi:hypothetical protein
MNNKFLNCKTMKKFNLNIFIVFLVVMLVSISCDKDKPELKYTGSDFIAFQDTLFSIEENTSSNFEIIVMRASAESNVNISLDLVVSSPDETAVEGEDYTIISPADGKISFGEGQFFDTIVVDIIDNVEEDGAKTLSFSLAGNPGGYVLGMPGPATRQKTCGLVISDNDCEFIPEVFTGKVSGVEFYPNSEFVTDAEFTLVDSTATTYIYEVTGIMKSVFSGWGEVIDGADAGTGSNEGIAIVTLDFTDPFNPTIYLEEQNLATTNDGAWIYDIYNSTTFISKFSTCDNTIELYYLINVAEPGTDYGANECYIKGEFIKE